MFSLVIFSPQKQCPSVTMTTACDPVGLDSRMMEITRIKAIWSHPIGNGQVTAFAAKSNCQSDIIWILLKQQEPKYTHGFGAPSDHCLIPWALWEWRHRRLIDWLMVGLQISDQTLFSICQWLWQGLIPFQLLQTLRVLHCSGIYWIFTAHCAKMLRKL